MILISTHILQSRESRKRAPVLLRATSSEIPCSVQLVRQVVTSPASSKPHSIPINVCRHRTNNPQHRLLNHILLYCQIILVRNAYRADNPRPLAEMRFLCLHGASTSGEVRASRTQLQASISNQNHRSSRSNPVRIEQSKPC